MEKIDISICCITYNHVNFIRDALDSFLQQKNNLNIEIIVHDDCSTDGTKEILIEYKKKYPKLIQLLLENENKYKYNEKMFLKTINAAKGKYIALCEGDDYWVDQYKLQKQFEFMEKNPECSYLCHATYVEYPTKKEKKKLSVYKSNKMFDLSEVLMDGLLFPTASIFTRKSIFSKIPDYYLYSPVEDEPLKLLCLTQGYGFFENEIMSIYRKGHIGSWNYAVKKNKEKRIEHHTQKIEMYKNFNRETDYRFAKECEKAILIEEFNLILASQNYKELNKEKFKLLIFNLKSRTKLRILFAMKFPNLYKKIYDFTHRR